MTKESKRIPWVDIAKFICIFFVMVTHIESCTGFLSTFLGYFFMNGFMFLSGYTYKNRGNFIPFIKKKSYQLLLPWFLWGVLSIVFHQCFASVTTGSVSLFEEILLFILQIRGLKDSVWFLNMMFAAYLIFFFVVRLYETKSKKTVFIAVVLCFILGNIYSQFMPGAIFPWGTNKLPWHLEFMPNAVFFMTAGYIYRNSLEEKVQAAEKRASLYLIFAYFLLVILSMRFDRSGVKSVFFLQIFDPMMSVLGVGFLVCLSKRIKENRFMLFVGQNTLLYFPMHVYVNTIVKVLMRRFFPLFYSGVLASTFASTVFTLVLALFMSVALIIPCMIINRYFPFFAGKPVKYKKLENC